MFFAKKTLHSCFTGPLIKAALHTQTRGKKPEKIASFCYVQTIQQRKVICRASAPFTSGLLGNLIEIYEPKP